MLASRPRDACLVFGPWEDARRKATLQIWAAFSWFAAKDHRLRVFAHDGSTSEYATRGTREDYRVERLPAHFAHLVHQFQRCCCLAENDARVVHGPYKRRPGVLYYLLSSVFAIFRI